MVMESRYPAGKCCKLHIDRPASIEIVLGSDVVDLCEECRSHAIELLQGWGKGNPSEEWKLEDVWVQQQYEKHFLCAKMHSSRVGSLSLVLDEYSDETHASQRREILFSRLGEVSESFGAWKEYRMAN